MPKKNAQRPDISISVYQQDWTPGFAAFHSNGVRRKGARKHVTLNLGSLLAAVATKDLRRADLPYMVAETIMHEIIHALEEWAGVEFSEERVEALLQAYQKKYAPPDRKVWKSGKPKGKRKC